MLNGIKGLDIENLVETLGNFGIGGEGIDFDPFAILADVGTSILGGLGNETEPSVDAVHISRIFETG